MDLKRTYEKGSLQEEMRQDIIKSIKHLRKIREYKFAKEKKE